MPEYPSIASFCACVVLFFGAMARVAPSLPRPPRAWLLGVGGVVLLQGLVVSLWVVHGPWATMTHGLERWVDLQDPSIPVNLQGLHGPGFLGTVGLLTALGLSPHTSSAVVLALVAPILGLAAWWGDADPIESGALVAIFALSPLVLRLGPTTCLYVPASLWLALALLAASAWLRTEDPWALFATSAAVVAAAHTRADFLLVAPLVVGMRLLAEAPWASIRARDLFMGALPGVLILPRLLELTGGPDDRAGHGPSLGLSEHTAPWLLWVAAATLLLRGSALRARVGLPVVLAVLAALALQLQARMELPVPAHLSPFLSWELHAPTAGLALGVALLAGAPRRLAWLVGTALLGALLYWPSADSASTFIRTGLAVWFAWCWLAAVGVGRLAAMGQRGLAAVLLALVVLPGPLLHHDWLAHRYPRQQEFDLIREAHRRLPPNATVTLLTTTDVPEGITVDTHHHLLHRSGVIRALGGANHVPYDVERSGTRWGQKQPWRVQSIREALSGDTSGPHYFLRTLDCHRHIYATDPLEVVAGDDLVGLDAAVQVSLFRPERDDEPIITARHLPRADAWCAALEEAFEVIPVIEVPVHEGNLGAAREQVIGPEPRIGLYRLEPKPTGR